jgi:hypothetical protein
LAWCINEKHLSSSDFYIILCEQLNKDL